MTNLRNVCCFAALFLGIAGSHLATAETFPTRCVQRSETDYSLAIVAPSAGYRFSLVRTILRGKMVAIVVRAKLEPGLHAQVLETHRLRFTLDGPLASPTRYGAIIDGDLNAPRPIVRRFQQARR